MATNPATEKQIGFLKKLTGQDYSNQELTAGGASAKIEKALANKAQDVADANLPEQEPKILPEHEKVISEAREEATKYAPQEIGMWWNNLGNRIGDGSIERDYPNTAVSIKSQYYSKMFKVTGVKPEKEEKKGE